MNTFTSSNLMTLTHGQQPRQPAIGPAVGRQAQQARPVGQVEPAADHQPDTGALGGDMGAHDSGQAVAVGHRDGGVTQRRGAQRQFLRMGGAAQESEVGGNLKLGIDRSPEAGAVMGRPRADTSAPRGPAGTDRRGRPRSVGRLSSSTR